MSRLTKPEVEGQSIEDFEKNRRGAAVELFKAEEAIRAARHMLAENGEDTNEITEAMVKLIMEQTRLFG